jgi:hypothetical protein
MRLPKLEHPDGYVGLYVVDFGATCSVGYTAEEVAMLLESEAHAEAKVYRIYDAAPDGRLALKGVPRERFQLETGLFFYYRDLEAARRGFEEMRGLASAQGLPCRAQLLLGAGEKSLRLPFVVGLAYPAEYDEDVSRWMLDNQVTAGEHADGGLGRLETIRSRFHVTETAQLHAAAKRQARDRQEVYASVGRPVQRIA